MPPFEVVPSPPQKDLVSRPDQTVQLAVRGMTCAACVVRVERALSKVPGVVQAQVNFATEMATVEWADPPDEAQATAHAEVLLSAIERAGYHAQIQHADDTVVEEVLPWWDVWGAVLLGSVASLPLVLPMLWGAHHFWPAWVQFALATPVQFLLGARFYKAGWAALKAGTGNMDQLVALGTSAAWGLSMWLWWRHSQGLDPHAAHRAPELYFESAAVVITLVLLGKALEARAKRQTTVAIRALQSLRPDTVHRQGPQGEVEVPLRQVLVDDVLIVRPGERIPTDGVVLEGGGHVDESLLTGEPLPVSKAPGDPLTGGAINTEARLLMRVTAVGGQTMLAHIIRRVVEAQAVKAPIQRLVDRVSAVFVPAVLCIALLTVVGWLWAGVGVEVALIRAVAVLVIACPCALGLATPAAIMAGTGAAARRGILIKDPESLEVAHRVQIVAFDKTGTLTQGRPTLIDWQLVEGIDLNGTHALQIAAALQTGSEHPLARAVLDEARRLSLDLPVASALQTVAGRGIQGVIAASESTAQNWALASTRWMTELCPEASLSPLSSKLNDWLGRGYTVSWLLRQGTALNEHVQTSASTHALWQVVALMAFGDELKPEAASAVQRLHELGMRTVMISGDNRSAAEHIGRQLGIQQVIAEVLPGDKADHIARLQAGSGGVRQVVAMVGDGINDAPALAAADVGMAMANPQGGADVALNAAGITLMRGDPTLVPAALDISRRTSAKIWQNLAWAFGYNIIGIPLAALGGLNPMFAGAAMALSSVSVVSNALLLSRWRA